MRYFIPLLIAPLLFGCVSPEEGIDDTRVRGTVVVPVSTFTESKDRVNYDQVGAEEVPEVYVGYTTIEGKVKTWGWDEETGDLSEEADEDWFVTTFRQPALAQATFDVPGAPEGTQVLVQLRDLEEMAGDPAEPAVLLSQVVTEFPTQMSYEFDKGHRYALAVGGVAGEGELDYTFTFIAVHPDEVGVKAGAYLPAEGGGAPDVTERGNPVAGGVVLEFEIQPDLTFVGHYEMLLARQVVKEEVEDLEDTGDGLATVVTVDEMLDSVYVFALDALTLNSLPAGTWYTSEPALVDLGGSTTSDTGDDSDVEYLVADPVQLDAYAPLVIGWELDEAEPNSLPVDNATFNVDVSDPSTAQDVGLLSGPGFVDIIRGTSPFETADPGAIHDIDAFMFQVPAALEILFTMDWDDDAADLDLIMVNSAGDWIDHGATTAKPEVNGWGGATLTPDETYFLVILGYQGTAGTAPAWEIKLEQLGR